MSKLLILLVLTWPFCCNAQNDIEIVKERVVREILKEEVSKKQIQNLLDNVQGDSIWTSINYVDVSRTGFQHIHHIDNLKKLSLAYSQKNSGFYKDEQVLNVIVKGLEFWCDHDFICENWWFNQLGVPRELSSILLLMDGWIHDDLKSELIIIIDRANLNAPGARPGGDRIKIGGIAAKKELIVGDVNKFREIMNVINNEIKFTTLERGIQHDYSFHHRTDRVNTTYSYGTGYADAFAEWAYYVNGTSFAFKKEQIEMLVDYYLDGICKQNVYGIYNNEKGVFNRGITRIEKFRPVGTSTPHRLLGATTYRANELNEIIKLRRGDVKPKASFAWFYWQTEHFVCQRPNFYTSVRMFSLRNSNMEQPYNSEGLKNHHRADGSNFHVVRGDEYTNIWPVYDWQKIPGTTVAQKEKLPSENEIQKRGLTSFVGAVTDGKYAAVGYDFISPHDEIKARKSWFFFDDEYVCLGAGIESYSRNDVVTTMNQCLLKGSVSAFADNKNINVDKGVHVFENMNWIHHDGFAYIFPTGATVHCSNQLESGYWTDINKQSNMPTSKVEKEVFKLWINHGDKPQGRRGGFTHDSQLEYNVGYQYVVVPCLLPDSAALHPNLRILANTKKVQAVIHDNLNIVQTIFYGADTLVINDLTAIVADEPMAIMLHFYDDQLIKITASDPSRKFSRLHFTLSGKLELKSGGRSFYDSKKNETEISLDLPQGFYAGKSVVVEL